MHKELLKQLDRYGNQGSNTPGGTIAKEAAKVIRDLLKQTEPKYFALVMESKMISAGHPVIREIRQFKTISQLNSFLGGLRDRDYISLKVDEYGLTEI